MSVLYAYICCLHVLDPLDGLALWVDHEGPAGAPGDNHAVLGGESVAWQTLDVPVSHHGRLHHKLTEVKVGTAGDPKLTYL